MKSAEAEYFLWLLEMQAASSFLIHAKKTRYRWKSREKPHENESRTRRDAENGTKRGTKKMQRKLETRNWISEPRLKLKLKSKLRTQADAASARNLVFINFCCGFRSCLHWSHLVGYSGKLGQVTWGVLELSITSVESVC